MTCQNCGQRPATVHFTKIVNGQKSEYHLCEVCARENPEIAGAFQSPFSGWMQPFSFNNFLTGMLHGYNASPKPQQGEAASNGNVARCPTCGRTLAEFQETGFLGCAQCYRHFASQIEPMLRRIHGHVVHTGKVPLRRGGHLKVERDLQRLQQRLQEAVSQENFEEAAKLRDEIRRLQGKEGSEAS